MGYEPANRQTTADFLVAVTDPIARNPRRGVACIPRTASEFAEYFRNSRLAQLNRSDLLSYRAEFVDKPEKAAAYVRSAYAERHGSRIVSKYRYVVELFQGFPESCVIHPAVLTLSAYPCSSKPL